MKTNLIYDLQRLKEAVIENALDTAWMPGMISTTVVDYIDCMIADVRRSQDGGESKKGADE